MLLASGSSCPLVNMERVFLPRDPVEQSNMSAQCVEKKLVIRLHKRRLQHQHHSWLCVTLIVF